MATPAYLGGKHSLTGASSGILYTDRRDFYLNPMQVAELYPSATPFYTFTSKLRTETSPNDPQFKCFEHRSRWKDMDFYIRSAIDWNSGGTYAQAAATISIATASGGSTGVPFIQKGDVIEIKAQSDSTRNLASTSGATGQAVSKNQVVARAVVATVTTSTYVGVTVVTLYNLSADGSDSWDVVANDVCRVITHADPEGADSLDGWMDDLESVVGQCQIIKTPLKLTGTLANAKLRGYDNERARIRAEKQKEHLVKLNGAFMRGYMGGSSLSSRATMPTNITDPNATHESYGNEWRFTWGIIPLIDAYGTTDYQKFSRNWANYSVDDFIDDMRIRYGYFNGDMNEMAFCGPKVVAEFAKTGTGSFFERSGGSVALSEFRNTTYNFRVRTLTHPFGTLNLVLDPAMADAPYDNYMVIVDPENIGRVVYRAPEFQAGIQDPDLDGFKDQYFSDEGLKVTLIEKFGLFKFA
jgi:hypothetical protein